MDFVKLGELVGTGVITITVVFFGYKMVELFVAQWKASTEALNRNTASFEKLSDVFEQANKNEESFREAVMMAQKQLLEHELDTNKKVTELHKKLVC